MSLDTQTCKWLYIWKCQRLYKKRKENRLKFTLLCPNRASKLVSMLNVQIERSCLYTIHAVPELKALVRGGGWLLGGNQHCVVSGLSGRGSLNVDIMSWKEVNRNFYHQSYFITYMHVWKFWWSDNCQVYEKYVTCK